MAKFTINGGVRLKGRVKISGSKNAVLPILAACLLTKEKCVIKNVPEIGDVKTFLEILDLIGVSSTFEKGVIEIQAKRVKKTAISSTLISKIRASILLLGPLLGREGKASLPYPGGCVLGRRPIDVHLFAFSRLGAMVKESDKKIMVSAKKLKGNFIVLPEISVTATENVIMAAVLATGETEIRLAAAEPHVQDLCHFLNKMGAKIEGIGTHIIKITGVKELKGVTYRVAGDYIEAGTFAIASVLTRGDVYLKGIEAKYLDVLWNRLREAGARIDITKNEIRVRILEKKILPIRKIRTAVYPSFATDLQAPFSVLLTQAKGESEIFETLFEGRFNYLPELQKMGAEIEIKNSHQAFIKGPSDLKGSKVKSHDLRAGAAMVLAALVAEGETEITNVNYIDRGYENLDGKLKKLGAKIKRS